MAPRDFNPLRLDVEAFAKSGGELTGDWPVIELGRLAASTVPVAAGMPFIVRWSVRGERRRKAGAEAEIWLHLKAEVLLQLECQRCLAPVVTTVGFERSLRFVAGENQAAALDAEIEDDVLALSRALDLRELVEDELLLALPLVPRHEVCPEPLPFGAAADAQPPARSNPFARLGDLKKPGPTH